MLLFVEKGPVVLSSVLDRRRRMLSSNSSNDPSSDLPNTNMAESEENEPVASTSRLAESSLSEIEGEEVELETSETAITDPFYIHVIHIDFFTTLKEILHSATPTTPDPPTNSQSLDV